tara:strand:- start:84 stop:572 length:489 start_codon:yes stop_codon:yes gene_type:complete
MKRLILILLLFPFVAIGQTINQKTYKFVQDPLRPWNKTSKLTSEVNFDITKIQDKYVQVTLFVSDDKFFSSAFHSLATTENKNIMMSASSNEKKWNVYDEGKLISLQDEIDVLNFFDKYGFELFKSSGDTVESANAFEGFYGISTLFFSKSDVTLTFKNNNN